MDKQNIKLCANCVYYEPGDKLCKHESAMIIDYTSGGVFYFKAQTHRLCNFDNHCRSEGIYYKEKDKNGV